MALLAQNALFHKEIPNMDIVITMCMRLFCRPRAYAFRGLPMDFIDKHLRYMTLTQCSRIPCFPVHAVKKNSKLLADLRVVKKWTYPAGKEFYDQSVGQIEDMRNVLSQLYDQLDEFR